MRLLFRKGKVTVPAMVLPFFLLAACAGGKGSRKKVVPERPATLARGHRPGRPGAGDHDFISHREACAHANSSPSAPVCRYDSDCGLCHDGSPCGRVMTAAEVRGLGDRCKKGDSGHCELFGVYCCAGRCVATPYNPGCKAGLYDPVGQCR